MKNMKRTLSVVLSIVMVLSMISVLGITTSAANTPFKPYDFKIEDGQISMKIDSEINSDTISNSYYFECCRFDLFMIASDSPTGLDPASNKDYNYCIVVRNDGHPTATDGAGVTKNGLTFTITLNTSIINNIKNYSAENPYVWLVIRPCSLANGLDNAFDENQNSMGFYHNKAASCEYFDSAICLGKYNSVEDFHEVKPASTLTLGDYDRATKTFCDASGSGPAKYGCLAIYVGNEVSDGDTITLPEGYSKSANSDDYKIYVNLSEPATAEEIAENLISKIKFEFNNEQNIRIELLDNEPDEAYFYCEENDHYYTFVDDTTCTWVEAYEAAKDMQYNGRQGYLATVTSKTEDTFIYNASGNKVGWLGSSRLMPSEKEGNYYNSFSTSEFTDNWCWSCGPEIGTEFFDTKDVRDEYNNNRNPSVIDVIFTRNTEKDYYFNWGFGEPSAGDNENALTTLMTGSGHSTGSEISNYAWNDILYDRDGGKLIGSGYNPSGYLVEFGDLTVGDSNITVNPSADGLVPFAWKNVTNVEYTPVKDRLNTYDVTINGRPIMVQFYEMSTGSTNSFDRNSSQVTIKSYDKDGNEVDSMNVRLIAYEVWTIRDAFIGEDTIKARVKENGSSVWEKISDDIYTFEYERIDRDTQLVSLTAAEVGKPGSFAITVTVEADVKRVMAKMADGSTNTVSTCTENADGTKTFVVNGWANLGDNTVMIRANADDGLGWHELDTVKYTATKTGTI